VAKVTIYRFDAWDQIAGEMKVSTRWGTREAINKLVNGRVLEETATEVDESVVASDIPGLTAKGWKPVAR